MGKAKSHIYCDEIFLRANKFVYVWKGEKEEEKNKNVVEVCNLEGMEEAEKEVIIKDNKMYLDKKDDFYIVVVVSPSKDMRALEDENVAVESKRKKSYSRRTGESRGNI